MKRTDEKALVESINQLMDRKPEPIGARLHGIDQQLGSMDRRLEHLEYKSDVLTTEVRLANSKRSRVAAVQNYTPEQLWLLEEIKMDKDPMRKRA